jgi:hypothetical protein
MGSGGLGRRDLESHVRGGFAAGCPGRILLGFGIARGTVCGTNWVQGLVAGVAVAILRA